MSPYPRPSPGCSSGPAVWFARATRTIEALGETHPASQGALGRYWASRGAAVPQWDASDPAAKAWKRASGADPGYLNRSHRRHLGR